MTTVLYDGSFEGWLTGVFEIYEYKLQDVVFAKEEASAGFLFGATHRVVTDEKKAGRVLSGLQKRLSAEGLKWIVWTFLSDLDQYEDSMWRFARHVFDSPQNVEEDLSNRAVWEVKKAANRVKRERHRMEAFVRFKLTKDGLYYAIIEPECDVLLLICRHFESRYADQRWLIYDARRKYGIYYDLEKVDTVALDFHHGRATSRVIEEISDEREEVYQELWRLYFKSVTIDARKNMRLHLQHMPKRYWKHLTEKMPGNGL
ncbi:TIGR03915 family putative DNA repair protein [Larkinella insperata]|uniref:TIGR03915 family putative DNA repair protein n=1 Tax=Larkinella insperata TaxID=332158 RepID=A0ABW3Q278_9BACT